MPKSSKKQDEIDIDTWLNILGNPYRRKILRLLSFRPLYPQQLAKILGITPRAVSKHLEQLNRHGVVDFKEKERMKGGRRLKLYHVPRTAFFTFEIPHPRHYRVKYSKGKRDLTPWEEKYPNHMEKINSGLTNTDREKLRLGFQALWDYHKELQELDEKRLNVMNKRENHFRQIINSFKDKKLSNMIIGLWLSLLERFGTTDDWSIKEVMNILNVDYDTALTFIDFLEQELQIIEFNKTANPRNPTWRLKPLAEKSDLSYR
ncbi:MAG: helix-turn-helix domain-containing protein [Candidatus Hodarchaeota archaeon]